MREPPDGRTGNIGAIAEMEKEVRPLVNLISQIDFFQFVYCSLAAVLEARGISIIIRRKSLAAIKCIVLVEGHLQRATDLNEDSRVRRNGKFHRRCNLLMARSIAFESNRKKMKIPPLESAYT
ncbi:hypothetical protein Dimus_000809 [Dionaea muscipula]